MKEIENTSIDGWQINPPEDAQKARQWIKTIESLSEIQNLSLGSCSDHKTENQEKLKF